MSAQELSGRELAARFRAEAAAGAAELTATGRPPRLAVVTATGDEASAWYVRSIASAAAKAGIGCDVLRTGTAAGVAATLAQLADDPEVHGVILQTPLPDGARLADLASAIPPGKDVDGANPESLGRLAAGLPAFAPATAAAVLALLDHYEVPLAGRHAVVVGRSTVVGKPVAHLLLDRHATVTICHSRTADLPAITREADVLVAAAGRAGLIRPEHVSAAAVVIDVGTNATPDGGLAGDVDPAVVAAALTPVPGGVGPVTTALLLRNVTQAASARQEFTILLSGVRRSARGIRPCLGRSCGGQRPRDETLGLTEGMTSTSDGMTSTSEARSTSDTPGSFVAPKGSEIPQASQVPQGSQGDRDFRPDVQGLRAIAVLLVVVYHVFPTVLPGGYAGVDVFFVISGYLITGHLWRTCQRTGRVRLTTFWGRRARRLIPAAAVVLTATWGLSYLLLPSTRLADTAAQVRASALYFQNWQLARAAVSYLTSDTTPTPVQHFWSLSVEEQFYLVWPLLFIVAALATRRRATATGPDASRTQYAVVLSLTVALAAASLAYSVYDTKADPAAAYFVTTTRMWELAAGGILALLPAAASNCLARRGWLGWAGLAMITASQFTLTAATPFPGAIAALPVAGSLALLAGGSAQATRGPWRLTSARPMTFLGGISYSLYLWHWPVIVLSSAWRGRPPGVAAGLAIIAVSLLLSWLTKVIVEDRVRLAPVIARSQWRSLSTALAAVVPVVLAAAFLANQPGPWNGRLPEKGYPGAAALADSESRVPAMPVLPPVQQASAIDVPAYWKADRCLDGRPAAAPRTCVFGDTAHPRLTVALVGDSIAGNWWAPLTEIADREHWKLVTDLHSGCPWTATQLYNPEASGAFPACHAWGAAVLTDLLTRIHPDVVITSGYVNMTSMAHPASGPQARADVGAGEATYWRQLESRGISVIAIRETPDMGVNEPTCVAGYGPAAGRCLVPESKAVPADPPTSYAARALRGAVPVIDMTSLICGRQVCPPVVGNVLVYLDTRHLTQSYSQTLAPYLRERLLAASSRVRDAG